MQVVYGDRCVDVRTVRRWIRRFKDGELGQADLIFFFHICHPGVFLLTHIISLLSVIHTIYSIMQTEIQGLHVSTVYGHLQALYNLDLPTC